MGEEGRDEEVASSKRKTKLKTTVQKSVSIINEEPQYLLGSGNKNPTLLRLFCRMRNRSLVSEREFTRLVDRSPWVVNVCLYFR